MDFNINDEIFENVKNTLIKNSEDENGLERERENELFLKICFGTATNEEKQEYNKITELSEDINDKLEEYCKIGHKMASQLDTNNSNKTEEKLNYIMEELKDLKEKINHLYSKIQ